MDVIVSFDTVTGKRLGRLPASSWQWTDEVNRGGSLSVTIGYSEQWKSMDIRNLVAPWRCSLAVISGGLPRFAGPVYKPSWDADRQTLTVVCGSVWDLLKKRLVVPASKRGFTGGAVPGDPDTGFPADWRLQYHSQTLGSIAGRLVENALTFGGLPLVVPGVEWGYHERNYLGPDLAAVEQRIHELTEVIDGPEVRFAPRLKERGRFLEWVMEWGSPELVPGEHRVDMRLPSQPVIGLTVNGDSAGMVTDAWASGGQQEDEALIAHTEDHFLTGLGWPSLQGADASHSTVSSVETLAAYTRGMVASRGQESDSVSFRMRRTDEVGRAFGDAVQAGDHVHLRTADPYMGDGVHALKVLQVGGDEGDWVTVGARPIIDWEAI